MDVWKKKAYKRNKKVWYIKKIKIVPKVPKKVLLGSYLAGTGQDKQDQRHRNEVEKQTLALYLKQILL